MVAGVVHIPPLVVAVLYGEFTVAVRLGSVASAGGGAYLALRGRERRRLNTREALVLTALTHPLFAALGAIVFAEAVPPVFAVFEAMSGFTTTGLSTVEPAGLPRSLFFYRAWAQWVGGVGVLLLGLGVLASTGRSRVILYESQFGPQTILSAPTAIVERIVVVYLILTVLGFVSFVAAGLSPTDAAYFAATTVSTAGFAPSSDSFAAYPGVAARGLAIGLMVLSALNFPALSGLPNTLRKLVRDPQSGLFVGLVGAVVLVSLASADAENDALDVVFHAVSAATTTGLSVGPLDVAPGVLGGLTLLMFVGGAGGSTAGGLKLWRLVLLARLAHTWSVRQASPRESVLPVRLYGRSVTSPELEVLGAVLFGFVVVFALTTLGLSATGVPLAHAAFEAASALGNAGLSAGITGPEMPTSQAIWLCFAMWCGRLEVLPVFFLLSPPGWRRGRLTP